MTAWGPHYPPELQRAVNHAERLATMLGIPEMTDPWAIGRAEEITSFVGSVIADWHNRVKDERAAAAAIDAYIGELHEGMRTHLGIRQPTCCNTTDTADEPPVWPR